MHTKTVKRILAQHAGKKLAFKTRAGHTLTGSQFTWDVSEGDTGEWDKGTLMGAENTLVIDGQEYIHSTNIEVIQVIRIDYTAVIPNGT